MNLNTVNILKSTHEYYQITILLCLISHSSLPLSLTVVVFVLKKISLKQNKSHSRSLDLHIVYVNEGLPE